MKSSYRAADGGADETRSLSNRTLDAFGWRFLSESSKLVLQIVVQVTLTRLLPVDAFGLLAVAALVVNFGSRLSEIGTGPALIQRAIITDTHVRAAFSVSVLCGATVTAGIWLGAPLAASLFKAGAVAPVLRVIGLVFVFGSLGTTAEALMMRRMDYRRLLKVEITSYALGYALVGIGLALLHYGVWALAWATVAQTILKTIMLVRMSPHAARPTLAPPEVGQLLNFGLGMTLGRLASFSAQNGDYFVVARWLGTTALGLYSRAYQLMCLPIYQFSSILNSVLFPAYSSIQNDPVRLRRGYLGSLSLSAIVVFPALTTIAIVSPELMIGVFGRQWAPAVVPLQILCLAGCCYCVYNLADSLVRAKGAVYVKFLYNSVYAVCVIGGAYVGRRWDITGVSVGVVAATAIVYLLMAHLSLRLTGSHWRAFFHAQLPGIVVAAGVAGIGVPVAILLRATGLPPLAILAGIASVCGATGVAAALSLPRSWLNATTDSARLSLTSHGRDILVSVRRHYRPQAI
jgi:PST family polysaccharide transporter